MQISEITAAAPANLDASRQTEKTAAAEFDAMLVELLLRQSGLLESLLSGDGEAGAGATFAIALPLPAGAPAERSTTLRFVGVVRSGPSEL